MLRRLYKDRGSSPCWLVGWLCLFVVVIVVLHLLEGFLRAQQKGLEGGRQTTCWFCYSLDVLQTFFVFMVFLYLLCSLPALDLCSILVMLQIKHDIVGCCCCCLNHAV